jgi:hypothetical protein
MADDIGSVRGISGTSMNLNTQEGCGTPKPSATAGTSNPGDTKPPRAPEKPVQMPK